MQKAKPKCALRTAIIVVIRFKRTVMCYKFKFYV